MEEKLIERLIHNHYIQKNKGNYAYTDIIAAKDFYKVLIDERGKPRGDELPKYKVGLMLISINDKYWSYASPMIESVRKFFLPGHDTEIMLWTDMPKEVSLGVTRFPGRTMGFPHPTLRRYELFLEQEEYLKKFDYIFFCDIDMVMVNIVGDEILGEGLTGAQHPMYAIRDMFKAPYERNPDSKAFVKTPDFYYAGGFQGGKTEMFIQAMKTMKDRIEDDLSRGVIARWNDEAHWNKYLIDDVQPSIVLSPSYIYPDSIIEEYYKKVWGCYYPPKIVCLTKPFAQTPEADAKLKHEISFL